MTSILDHETDLLASCEIDGCLDVTDSADIYNIDWVASLLLSVVIISQWWFG